MHGSDIDPRRIRTLMGFQHEGPLSGVYIMRGGAVGGEHTCATNPSCSRPLLHATLAERAVLAHR
jgi:hypothetical protein